MNFDGDLISICRSENSMTNLMMFAYGSMKVGEADFEQFCSGYVSVEPAYMQGVLYRFPSSGNPVAEIREENILALGTGNPWEDTSIQQKYSEIPPENITNFVCEITPGGSVVHGELFMFEDPELRIPEMDWLEGYRPGRRSYYKRVLTYVCLKSGEMLPVWTYVLGLQAEGLVRIPSGVWKGKPKGRIIY